jgi:hypothetical protein
VLTLNPKILSSIPKQLKKANKNFNILIRYVFSEIAESRTSDEFNERISTLQISTETNDRSLGERKPAKINELRAKYKDCVGVTQVMCHTGNGALQMEKIYRSNHVISS